MSRTELYRIDALGDVHLEAEFSNAFRGAYLVWQQMCQRYLHQDMIPLFLRDDRMQEVWDLWKDQTIPLAHRIVMASTFDNVMIRREELPRLIEAIEEYAQVFDPGTLLEQADKLRELAQGGDTIAVCWNATSVCANPWWCSGNDEDDEGRPYNIYQDTGHRFLFDGFDTQSSPQPVTDVAQEEGG